MVVVVGAPVVTMKVAVDDAVVMVVKEVTVLVFVVVVEQVGTGIGYFDEQKVTAGG